MQKGTGLPIANSLSFTATLQVKGQAWDPTSPRVARDGGYFLDDGTLPSASSPQELQRLLHKLCAKTEEGRHLRRRLRSKGQVLFVSCFARVPFRRGGSLGVWKEEQFALRGIFLQGFDIASHRPTALTRS